MKLNDFLTESNLDGYYLSQKAAELWVKDNPGKQKKDFFRVGVDVQDKYTEKAGGKKEKYLGKGASQWRTESLEALARHVKESVPLPDSLFRYQSEAYFDTFKTAKQLREAGSLPELDWESEEMLGTDIGESVELKGVGRVWLDVPYLNEDESIEEAEEGMIGEPDNYYDAEERKEAYDDLQTALDGVRNDWEKQSVIDGICPECSGTSYMDGDYDNDEDSCYGWGNYGCDQGEMENASWVEIIKFDQQNVDGQKAKDNYPGDEEVIKQAAKMMPNMDDPRMIVQQLRTDYPQLGRAKASDLAAKAKQIAFPESVENESMGGKDGKAPAVPYSKSTEKDLADRIWKASDERKRKEKDEKNKVKEGDSEDAPISKMLAKALGDENRWTEMTPQELFAELESKDSETADMIALLAKSLYDVKLKERAYKDVGVADVVKDQRGKEFKFDKGSKQFKSIDGEVAGVNTKLGKDLLRLRRNAMKRTSPSYPKNKMMASIGEAEYQGKDVELNKPKRGGSKKYYVYVKNPKTGNVKKISFGDPGLKTKSGNKKRAKSFAARHNCEKKNDKMKAGYWACRLPRYGLVKGGKWW
jgi:hypothetical protein